MLGTVCSKGSGLTQAICVFTSVRLALEIAASKFSLRDLHYYPGIQVSISAANSPLVTPSEADGNIYRPSMTFYLLQDIAGNKDSRVTLGG